jgi:hypothetical protein
MREEITILIEKVIFWEITAIYFKFATAGVNDHKDKRQCSKVCSTLPEVQTRHSEIGRRRMLVHSLSRTTAAGKYLSAHASALPLP